MKRIFLLLPFLILGLFAQAQVPSFPYSGNTSTGFGQNGPIGSKTGFVYAVSFADTTAINNYQVSGSIVGFLKNVPGIGVRVVDDIYIRSNDLSKWIKQINSTSTIGTVTTVGALSPLFTTSNATTTPTFSLISQSANKFFASPNGSSGVASFRSIVAADLPSLNTLAWLRLGNSGTVAGTDFIGTTDNVKLMFKVNSVQSGLIDHILLNTSFGYQSLLNNAGGANNTAFGAQALTLNTGGIANTAFGVQSLASVTNGIDNTAIGGAVLYTNTGDNNTAIGYVSMYSNSSGGGNIGVGKFSGYYNTTAANQYFLNNQDRANYAGDTTKSLVYGIFNATAASQRFKINGRLEVKDGSQSSGYVFVTDANGAGTWTSPTSIVTATPTLQQVATAGSTYTGDITIHTLTLGLGAGNISTNTALGLGALGVNTSGNNNVGIANSLVSNFTGVGNVGIGNGALYNNFSGSFNTAIGLSTLTATVTNSRNIALGYQAGLYTTDASPAGLFIVNSFDRTNEAGDSTKSILWGVQNATVSSQRLKVNGKFEIVDGTQGASKVFTSDANGRGSWQTPTTGTVTSVSGTANQIAVATGTTTPVISLVSGGTLPGAWNMTSPAITTSVTTPSTTFGLLNTNATTVNAFGAATTLNIGASAAMVLNLGGSTTAAQLRFLEPSASGTNFSAFKAVAQAADITYSLPPTVGAAGTFLKDVAGNGVLTWGTASATPAGSNTQIQYNNSGSFGADGNLTWDGTIFGIGNNGSSGTVFVNNSTHTVILGDPDGVANSTIVSIDDGTGTVNISGGNGIFFNGGILNAGYLSGNGYGPLTYDNSGNITNNTGLVPLNVASADLIGQTTAVSSVATYTPGANGTYRIGGYINITAASASTITLKVTYTDENSVSVTQIIPLTLASTGAVSTTAVAISNNSATDIQIRAKSGSAITVLTTVTGVSRTYDVGGTIEFLR